MNQLKERFCYISKKKKKILTKRILTLPKDLNPFLLKFILPKNSNLMVGYICKHPCMDICTFNDHYLNILLDNLSKKANNRIFLLPQTVTWTLFRAPIPAISHFVRLGFSPEKREKVLNISTMFWMDCASFRKYVVSSAYLV